MFNSTSPQNRPRVRLHQQHQHVRKSWRSGTSTTLPGWRYHTGGSRSIPTVHPCLVRQGGCVLHDESVSAVRDKLMA